jgi:hypothetical protein
MVKTMHSYSDESNILRMIKSGGLLSKTEQVIGGEGGVIGTSAGSGGSGESASADLLSGGALGVFMTPVSKTGLHEHAKHWDTRGTEVVFDGESMLRDLGWWAHGPDDGPFGVLNPDSHRMAISQIGSSHSNITKMANRATFEFLPDSAAETGKMRGVLLTSGDRQQRKAKIIAELQAQGITEVNGIPLEDFFITTPAEARKAFPDYEGSSINGFKVGAKPGSALAKQEAAAAAALASANTGQPVPKWITKGKMTNKEWMVDATMGKTSDLKMAEKRARQYVSKNPGERVYIFMSEDGHYRVAKKNMAQRIHAYKKGEIISSFSAESWGKQDPLLGL